MKRRIRVLIADDSMTVRNALTRLLADDAELEVIGQAQNGVEAVSMAESLRPDVITMDILMPELDGLGAIGAIMAQAPSRVLVVSSVVDDKELELSFRAMAAGALEVIGKPTGKTTEDLRQWGRRVAESVRLMAEVPVVTRRRLSNQPCGFDGGLSGTIDAFAIASSTGGPPALALILAALPKELPIPVFLAQHLTPGFTLGLVSWLASVSPLAVVVAKDGTVALPGHVYLPPDGQDLSVDGDGLLRVSANEGGACPSGDKLLLSVAKAYRNRAGGAVLTGMGEDGARGLLAIRQAGGVTMAQDEATCVVFGMPNAARANGATENLVSLESMVQIVRQLSLRVPRSVRPTVVS